MDEEDYQDREFSILKKSVFPNLLIYDFKSYNENEKSEQTFITEVSSDIHEEEKAENTADSMDQQEKRKCFEKDFDFRKTLINEESLENVKGNEPEEPVQSSSTEYFVNIFTLNSHILDIFAAIGFVMVIIEFVFYIL